MSDELKTGAVVYSTQGRDKDNYYVCVTDAADGFVFVCDGKSHKMAKPKRKNVKHLKRTGLTLTAIAEKIAGGKKVFDSEIGSSLRNIRAQR